MDTDRIASLAIKLADDYVNRYHKPRETSTDDVAAPLELPAPGETLPTIKKLFTGKAPKEG